MPGNEWSQQEVERTVAAYFHMMRLELLAQPYNKAAHNRMLLAELAPGRTRTGVERKHQNISAILRDEGQMWLRGYAPLGNYQQLLAEVVSAHIEADALFDQAALNAVSKPAETPVLNDFASFVVDRPAPRLRVERPAPEWHAVRPIVRDYLTREANNRSLGAAGERLAVDYEMRRLHGAGLKKLAEKVELVSHTRGDGLGFDILSFEAGGKERFIEVKTTEFVDATPFFVSRNEVRFSEQYGSQFRLYRLFDFRSHPRMFELVGPVSSTCRLDEVSYRAVPL